jgi:hypothetical protein
MAIWERERPPRPEVQPADWKFPFEDFLWNNKDPAKKENGEFEKYDL